MEIQLVIFDLANEYYGLDIGAVDGIIAMQEITTVPQAPSFVEGITNLRGSVLPVIDLRKRFGLSEAQHTKDTRIVVVVMGEIKVGMVVDAVSEVLRVPEESIEPPSPLVASAASTFITGIAKIENRMIILVDLGKVLSVQEQAELESAGLAKD
jgi:purine-binding chemotaxis protein CheW